MNLRFTKITLGIFTVLAVLAGCAMRGDSSVFHVATADFRKADSSSLCVTYGFRMNRVEEARNELVRRNLFSLREWSLIDAQKIEVGMSECGVKAAWPLEVKSYSHVRNLSGKLIEVHMVYSCNDSPAPFCPFTRVVLSSGKVTAIIPDT